MKKIWATIGVLGVALGIALDVQSRTLGALPTPPWAERMRGLSQALTDLLYDLSSDERAADPASAARIEANAKKLAESAHAIGSSGKAAMVAPDADPTIPMIASLFDQESKRAYHEWHRGNRVYARDLLRTVAGYCIACHTRNNSGPRLTLDDARLKTMSAVERAEFYVATRRFEQALKEFDQVIGDPLVINDRPLEWERSIYHALAITVRVNRDPERSLHLVQRILDEPTAPLFIKADATAWKTSLLEWKKEGIAPAPAKSVAELRALADRIMTHAQSIRKFATDHSADVEYLRATTILHDLLARVAPGVERSQALYQLGCAYNSLQDLDLWTLHELFFESCIRNTPHTAIALQCYEQYEASAYENYSGSAGVALPGDVKQQLRELHGLAVVK